MYGCLRADEKYIDKEGKVLFDPTGYMLIDKKSEIIEYNGQKIEKEYSLVYSRGLLHLQFVFFELSACEDAPRVIFMDLNRIKTPDHHFSYWLFDFDAECYVIDPQVEEAIEEEGKRREHDEWAARQEEEDIGEANRLFKDMMDEYEAWGNID